MLESVFKTRVLYADTDRMGYLHHSNYLRLFETARWELFRSIGIPYSLIEAEGFILPVTAASIVFKKPAVYDQELEISTSLVSFRGPRIFFEYRITDETGEMISRASVTVACARSADGKACQPQGLLRKLSDLATNSDGQKVPGTP